MKKLICFGVISLMILAGNTAKSQTLWDGTADVSWYTATQTSFNLSTPEQLAGVAQLVSEGVSFNGATLHLISDIWLNDMGDSISNWMPIGGGSPSSESPITGNAFQGTFNGHGHMIYNLYCEKENSFHAGLFGALQYPCTIDSVVLVNPVVKSKGMMGAIAGFTRSGGEVHIRYCMVINARIVGTPGANNNNIGGIIGGTYANNANDYVENCGVTGYVAGNVAGGLGGNCVNTTFTNCYFAGHIDNYNASTGAISAYAGTINNCYSSSNITTGNLNGTVVPQDTMRSESIIAQLGGAFKMDYGINDGYPILACMRGLLPLSANLCLGESITLNAYGYDSYLWSTGETTSSITVFPDTTTTYTLVGTIGNLVETDSIIVTVYPEAEIYAQVIASSDGNYHAYLDQYEFVLPCQSPDTITLLATPDPGWRVNRVTFNDNEIYGDVFGEGPVNIRVYPGGVMGTIKIYISNTYDINIQILEGTGETLTLSNLVDPYGNDGVVSVESGNSQTFTFQNTLRYVLTDVTVDGTSLGAVGSYSFSNIHDNHTIVATYVENCGISTLPFFENFETTAPDNVPDCYTAIQTYNYPSVLNSADKAHSGNNSLYTFLYSAAYNHYIVLPKILDTVTYPLSALRLTFWARTSDASNSFTVGVIDDAGDVFSFTPIVTLPATSTSYDKYTAYIGETGAGHQYIAIKFNCGSSYTESNIDDITLDFAPQCTPVSNLTASNIYGSNVMLSWTHNHLGTPHEHSIIVRDLTNGSESIYTTTETSYVVTGLTEYTPYQMGVFSACDVDETSDTVFINLTTPCTSPVDITVGDGNYTTSRFPSNSCYKYSYTQQILTSATLGSDAMDFTSIFFQCTSVASAIRKLDIYAALIPNSSTLASGWVMPSDSIRFLPIYSGNVTFTSNNPGNWLEIPLDTILPYNGTDDILIAVVDRTGSWNCSNVFKCHSDGTTAYKSRYTYRDASPYNYMNPQEPGFPSNDINNIRFSSCDESECIRPNTILFSNITDNSADMTWISPGSATSWEVEYMGYGDTDWTSAGTLTSTDYTFTGLASNTQYSVRIRTLCDGNETSRWSDISGFRTNCASISNLPFFEDFEDESALYYSGAQLNYVVCWERYASNAAHFVYVSDDAPYANSGSHFLDFHYTTNCYNIAIMPAIGDNINVRDLMTTFWACHTSGNSGTLELGVMSDPEDESTFVTVDTIDLSELDDYQYAERIFSFANYQGEGKHIAFRASNAIQCGFYIDDISVDIAPGCSPINNIALSGVTSSSAIISWEPGYFGDVQHYTLEYSEEGLNNWTTVNNIYSSSYTLTNLQPSTYYDVRVKANCSDTSSVWMVMTLRTKCLVGGDSEIGNGTLVNTYLPSFSYYNYSYSQQLFLATEIGGPKNIEALTLDMATYVVDRTYQIYLMHTSATTAANWIDATNAQLVFSSVQSLHEGLNTFQFSNPFQYNGYDNLLLIMLDMTGTYTSGNTWRTHSTPFVSSQYIFQDEGQYYITSTPTSGVSGILSERNNVIFSAACDTTSSCATPYITITSITSNSAVVSWIPGYNESAWELEYALMGDTNWTVVGAVTSMSETINGLTPNTAYKVRMRSNCGSSYSYWTEVSFTTLCGAFTVTETSPWIENFESIIGGGAESFICWETPVMDNVYHSPYVYCGSYEASHSGANTAELKGTNCMLALPAFTNDINTLRLSFWATATDTTKGTLEVGVLANLEDPSSFESLYDAGTPGPRGTVYAGANGNFMGPFDFNDAQTPAGYIALRYTSTLGTVSWNLDDFTVELIPSCPIPHHLNLTNVGMTTATLSWSGNGNAVEYIVEYGPAGFTPGTGTSVTTTIDILTLTGLTPNTSYTVYVTAFCGNDDFSSTASVNFQTANCDPSGQCAYTFNLTDSYGDGWNHGYLEVKQSGVTVATLTLPTGSSATQVVNLCNNISTTLLWHSGFFDSEAGFSLIAPTGAMIYSTSTMEYFNTYTFTTSCANSGPASCDVPSHVIISDTTENSARVSWVAGGTESQWKLQYKSITASNWEPDIILATTSHILSNLQENTAYILRVKAICDSTNESDWTSLVTFTTLDQTIIIPDTCETPTGLTATAVTAQTITVSWDYEENVDLWNIQYRPDDGAVSSATSTTNTFTLSGLEPETTYEIQVQADCGEGEISDWSEYISVTTPVGIENHLMRYVHLYPNPAKEYIDIRVDGEMNVISMEVYDIYGKLVNMVNVAENPTRINVNGLANGMYFVRVTTDQGEVTKSFVKH